MKQAPKYPIDAPVVDDRRWGCDHPEHGPHCIDCVPLSLYYLGRSRLPDGWTWVMKGRRQPTCTRCGE